VRLVLPAGLCVTAGRHLARLYFALDAREWSETQDGAVRTAPVQAGFDALTRMLEHVSELGCSEGAAP
jgi:hypothetical protein